MKPMKIDVLGIEYSIELEEHMPDDNWGIAEHRTTTLKIAENLEDSRKRETLLHEVMHAVDATIDIGLEEEVVGPLSAGLFCVLKSNPELREALFAPKEPPDMGDYS